MKELKERNTCSAPRVVPYPEYLSYSSEVRNLLLNQENLSTLCSSIEYAHAAATATGTLKSSVAICSEDAIGLFVQGLSTDGRPFFIPVENLWWFGSSVLERKPGGFIRFIQTIKSLVPNVSTVVLSGIPVAREDDIQQAHSSICIFSQKIHTQEEVIVNICQGLTGYLSRLSSGKRKNMKRSLSVGEGLEFEYCRTFTNYDALWMRLLRIEKQSWKHSLGESTLLADRYAFFIAV